MRDATWQQLYPDLPLMAGYVIERSVDGKPFEFAANVPDNKDFSEGIPHPNTQYRILKCDAEGRPLWEGLPENRYKSGLVTILTSRVHAAFYW